MAMGLFLASMVLVGYIMAVPWWPCIDIMWLSSAVLLLLFYGPGRGSPSPGS